MASESTKQRPTAAESLVKATVAVLDNVHVQAHMDRASMETAKRLGAHTITFLGWTYRKVIDTDTLGQAWT